MTESATYKISETIARLDVLEQNLLGMVQEVRQTRHALFELLDTDE